LKQHQNNAQEEKNILFKNQNFNKIKEGLKENGKMTKITNLKMIILRKAFLR
jgi:hypothetical protein